MEKRRGRPKGSKNKTTKKICGNCEVSKAVSQFYKSNSILFDGYIPFCKKCVNDLVDIENMDTVYDMLRQLDVKFDYSIWGREYDKGGNVFGNYLRHMNLKQYRDQGWEHSVFQKEDYSNGQYYEAEEEVYDPQKEKKIYSKKWMGYYTSAEIEYLENYLKGLHNDFKITTGSHRDYAMKIAKASLHMDKCYQDMMDGRGDSTRYKNAKEVFDSLSKSAQFTEERRGQNDVSLGSFGKVFERVESKTYIPKHIPVDPDELDNIIEDFKHIFKSL